MNDSRVKWEHNNLTRNDWSRVMVRSVERGQNSRLWVAIHHLSYKSKMKTKKNLSQKEIERRQYQSSIDKLQSDTSIERIKKQEKSKLLAFTLAIVILCICILIGYSIFISHLILQHSMQNQPKTSAEEMKDHLNMLERRREKQRQFLIAQEIRKSAQERLRNIMK